MTDIVERANKALEGVTPGPWEAIADENAAQVQGFPIVDSKLYEIIGVEGFYGDYEDDWANARFVAAARELVPELVAEIERLRMLLKEARDELAAAAEAEWPERLRVIYPSFARKYERDMDLCHRIDAALEGEKT